jgi:hypothetical protein
MLRFCNEDDGMVDSETRPRAAVIAISGYRKGGALSSLDEVEEYWTRLRAQQGDLPTRAQLDPRGFSRALSNCFVAEAITPRHLRLRLSGQHLQDLMGMDLRGMPLSALVLPDSRPVLEELIEDILSERRPGARVRIISPRSYGRQALFGGLLLLPLAREAGTPPRILGALATVGTVGWTPRRFQILGLEPASTTDTDARPALRVIEGGVSDGL